MPGSALLRRINQARVLRLLKEQASLSRAEIARYLELTRSTVTLVTAELLTDKLIVPTGELFVTQNTGRPGVGLKLNPEGAFFLGAEIGADELHLVLIDLSGAIIYRETQRHRTKSPKIICRELVSLVDKVWSKRLNHSDRLRGVGVAASALLDTQGIVRKAPTLGWRDFDLKNELLNKFSVPAFAENDANAAALAELSFGARIGCCDLCVLLLNFGIGAGIIAGRTLFRGHSGLAGEIGHLCLDPSNHRSDEEWGPLENCIGRETLLESYRGAGGQADDLQGFLAELKTGGPAARKSAEIWAEWLALAISNLADIVNPQLIVLAGPLSEIYPFIHEKVRHWLRERKFPTVANLEIQVSSFGRDAAALGGAALVFNDMFSVPDASFLSGLSLR
jgi:predicted NBD/HSP70 family sugar kinase